MIWNTVIYPNSLSRYTPMLHPMQGKGHTKMDLPPMWVDLKTADDDAEPAVVNFPKNIDKTPGKIDLEKIFPRWVDETPELFVITDENNSNSQIKISWSAKQFLVYDVSGNRATAKIPNFECDVDPTDPRFKECLQKMLQLIQASLEYYRTQSRPPQKENGQSMDESNESRVTRDTYFKKMQKLKLVVDFLEKHLN